MLIDVETRRLIAQDHVERLREAAAAPPPRRRARRWIGVHLIAAGEHLATRGQKLDKSLTAAAQPGK